MSTADAKFPKITLSSGEEVTVSYGQYRALLATRREQSDRESAFRALHETYRATLVRMQDMVREMVRARKSREEIQKMLEMEFGWSGFVTTLGLDGVIGEMQ